MTKSPMHSLLAQRACLPTTLLRPLDSTTIRQHLDSLSGWAQEGSSIQKVYTFLDYYQTIAFVNAIAWIAHRENHHPDLSVRYNCCTVAFSTHDIQGISENDLICAAKIESLF